MVVGPERLRQIKQAVAVISAIVGAESPEEAARQIAASFET